MRTRGLDLHSKGFYPCIDDGTGHVRKRLSDHPMSFAEAERVLIDNYHYSWAKNQAYPQPITDPYFSDDPEVTLALLKYKANNV